MRIGRGSGDEGLELSCGAGVGALSGSVAEAGESAVVRIFKSNSCRSDLRPSDVAEKMTGNFLKVSSFSIAVAMIPVLLLRLRLFDCSGAMSVSLRQVLPMFFMCDKVAAL